MAAALEQPAQSERSTSFSPSLARSPSLALILSSCGRKTDRVCVYGRGRGLAHRPPHRHVRAASRRTRPKKSYSSRLTSTCRRRRRRPGPCGQCSGTDCLTRHGKLDGGRGGRDRGPVSDTVRGKKARKAIARPSNTLKCGALKST